MNILSLTNSHTLEYINRMPTIIRWFESKGIYCKGSRYTRYLNYINEFNLSNPENEIEHNTKFIAANEAFQECIQIVDIFEKFKSEDSEGFIDRLEKVVKGPDFFDNASKNDSSRDFLYELTIAVELKARGYIINFDKKTDVIATQNNDTFLVECKRLRSIKKLEDNFKKAGKQLIEETNNHNEYGLIFIDIYNCISDKIKLKGYNSVLEMNDSITTLTNEFYEGSKLKIEALNDRFLDNSLAVCFTSFKNLWLSNMTPQYFRKINDNASQYILDRNYNKLEEVMSILKK